MKYLPFTKVEAIGNSFILVNALDLSPIDWPSLAQQICSHHFGVGADGLLVLLHSTQADFRLQMFNPDGTEDACGNGLRCATVFVCANGLSNKSEIDFEAVDGIRRVEIIQCDSEQRTVRVNMGRPSLRAIDIPADLNVDEVIDYPLEVAGETHTITCVSVGTPHAVILVPESAFRADLPKISRLIETHPAFPERINVTWCSNEPSDKLRIRTWERAVGPTLGCGTGACAALVAANLHGIVGLRAEVASPGGVLEVEWSDREELFMTGPANLVFQGMWP